MSDLTPDVVWPASTEVDETRWRRIAAPVAFWTVMIAGAALTLAAPLNAPDSLRAADGELWVLAALALAADLVPFRLPRPARQTTTFLLSPCFCFSILLLYPPASGILIQVVAVALVAPRLRLPWPSLAFLAARLVCSLGAAGWAAEIIRGRNITKRYIPGPREFGIAVVVALVFLAVTMAISVVGAFLSRATRAEIGAQLRIEVIARGSVLLIGVIIVSTPTLWSHALLAVPLLAWWQLSRLLERREHAIEHDPATGLLNVRGLASAIADLPRIHTPGVDHWYGLIVIELRGITHVRRTLGQDVAERLTSAAAQRLRSEAAASASIGRLSESQLVVMRPEPDNQTGRDTARRFVASLREPIECDGITHRLDAVAGIVHAPQHGQDVDALIANAEAALVEANLHHERIWTYTPAATADVDDRLTLLREFRETLRDPTRTSEIVVLFQPQVSLATGEANSVEALLRWFHPDRGLIPTDTLIELVEPTGVMQELTTHILDRVVRQLAEWNHAGINLRATVNVSVYDLLVPHFDTHVADTLQLHGVPAHQLDIEVTERALITETPLLDEATGRVAALGVGLSLDDFGTGFASLRRLRQMPLTEVKIDRSYVSRITDSPADLAIVTTIHDIAQTLSLRVVAEGIEDEQTATILAGLDGVIGQGWLYARAMPADELVNWLKHHAAAAD
jgi:predicted signal transduction protein with EAL and GGDEF domain